MLTTVGQGRIFTGCLLAGFLMGLVYEAGYILRFCFAALFKESKKESTAGGAAGKKTFRLFNAEKISAGAFSFVIDIIFFGVCFILILFSSKTLADGQIFWFSVLAYVTGFIIERIILGIIVAKFINLIYNTLAKGLERLKKVKFFKSFFR